MMRPLLIGTFCLFCALAAGLGWWYWDFLHTPAPGLGQESVIILRGAGVREIGTILADKGLVKNDVRFLILARTSGLATRLKAGEFAVPRGLTPPEVLQLLARGKVVQYHVTIAEGLTMARIASILADKGWVEEKSFLALCRDRQFIASLGLAQNSLEGYLFPDTYALTREDRGNAGKIITTMVGRFFQVWKEVAPGRKKKGAPQTTPPRGPDDLSRHQIVTLASIIEKETAKSDERPLIAGVFYNRLRRGMRLQSDPTTIYGLTDFNGNLTRKDLRGKTPYNTYVIAGLPPGPICNPGKAALTAALHPAATDALFFVARNDGRHQFSATLKEHNRAVRKYQLRGKKK